MSYVQYTLSYIDVIKLYTSTYKTSQQAHHKCQSTNETVAVMFRCVELFPGVLLSLETVTMRYTNYHNFITERFYKNSIIISVPCIIGYLEIAHSNSQRF